MFSVLRATILRRSSTPLVLRGKGLLKPCRAARTCPSRHPPRQDVGGYSRARLLRRLRLGARLGARDRGRLPALCRRGRQPRCRAAPPGAARRVPGPARRRGPGSSREGIQPSGARAARRPRGVSAPPAPGQCWRQPWASPGLGKRGGRGAVPVGVHYRRLALPCPAWRCGDRSCGGKGVCRGAPVDSSHGGRVY